MHSDASAVMAIRAANHALTQTSIRSTSIGRNSRVARLMDTIFGLLPAVYGNPESRRSQVENGHSANANPSDSWIAKEFYLHHFCSIKLRRDSAGNEILVDEFINEISTFGASEDRNRVFFLQGKIGSGKTALINHIITKHGNDLIETRGTWFLRVNIDVMRHSENQDISDFMQSLEKKN